MNDGPQSEPNRRVLRLDCKIDYIFSIKYAYTYACVRHNVCACAHVRVRGQILPLTDPY